MSKGLRAPQPDRAAARLPASRKRWFTPSRQAPLTAPRVPATDREPGEASRAVAELRQAQVPARTREALCAARARAVVVIRWQASASFTAWATGPVFRPIWFAPTTGLARSRATASTPARRPRCSVRWRSPVRCSVAELAAARRPRFTAKAAGVSSPAAVMAPAHNSTGPPSKSETRCTRGSVAGLPRKSW